MEQKNIDKIDVLIRRWGIPMQLVIANEESAELSKACSKLLRGRLSRDELVDALGDMYVMMQTMCMIYGVSVDELEEIATKKLDEGLAVPYEETKEESKEEIKE